VAEPPAPDEAETDDLPEPPAPPPTLHREINRGLREGREFYDSDGKRLMTLEAILLELKRRGRVLGPQAPQPVLEDTEIGDVDDTAVVGPPL
jgi:hypothetical protein